MADDQRTTTFTSDGLTFDTLDEGPLDGEPIVLLHGFPETSSSWSGVVPLLAAAGHRVLAPDQRGYSPGARPKARAEYTSAKLAGDVVALADTAGIDRFHLVGHDWGGAVAWYLAAAKPERVSSLTVLSTPHPRAMVSSMVHSAQALRSWYMGFFQLPKVPEALLGSEQRLRRSLVRGGLPESYADASVALFAQPGAATGALNWYRAVALSRRDGPGPVTVPTLYVWSTDDFALGRWAAEHTADWVTGPYRFEVLEGVSHWIPETVPERTAQLVLEQVAAVADTPDQQAQE